MTFPNWSLGDEAKVTEPTPKEDASKPIGALIEKFEDNKEIPPEEMTKVFVALLNICEKQEELARSKKDNNDASSLWSYRRRAMEQAVEMAKRPPAGHGRPDGSHGL